MLPINTPLGVVALELIATLEKLEISAWVEGTTIRCRGINKVPPHLAAQIRQHKPALLHLLRHNVNPDELPPIPPYNPRDFLEDTTQALATRLAALDWLQIQILGETPTTEAAWLAWLDRRLDSDRHLYTLDAKLREIETDSPPAPHIPTGEELLAKAEAQDWPKACIVMAQIEGRQAWLEWTDKHHHDPVYMRIAWLQLRGQTR